MNHDELVKIVLSIHGPVLAGGLVAYYRFGDRSEMFKRSLEGTEQLIKKMRDLLALQLGYGVEPLFRDVGRVTSHILQPDGENYAENWISPVGSEQYRETLKDFVDANADLLADYHAVAQAKVQWCKWARRLSWALLLFWFYQAFCAGSIAVFDWVCSVSIPDWLLKWSFAPTGILFVLAAVARGLCHRHHDTICDLREEHDGS